MSDAPPGRAGRSDDVTAALRRARDDARVEVGDALHDGVVQSMTALMMRVAVGCIDAPPAVRAALEAVELDMSQVVAELRDLITDLRSPTIDAEELPGT